MKVLISGGGIGGLTSALCCLHAGHEVTLFEKAPALAEIGAGIQVPPNAMKVFQRLGLDKTLTQVAFQPDALEARMGRTGRQIFRIELGAKSQRRWGAPYLHIHRADYIGVLTNALLAQSPEAIKLGAEVAHYTQNEDSVSAHLADGTQIKADVLIAADGLHSPLRTQMLGPQKPVFTGNMAWRAVVPLAALGENAPPPSACVWMERGAHCVTYRLRQGELANFVGVVERDNERHESWTQQGTKDQALADFKDWHPTLTGILSKAETLYRWALFDRPPLSTWVDGRVALLGDAAHPMLPFMAQGAAMAVEDAWVLAQKLSEEISVYSALKAYEQARFTRASFVQAGSRANAKTFHRRSKLSQIATYGPMWLGGKLAPNALYRHQDPLYAYDVTAL